jgi:hypothetical protein
MDILEYTRYIISMNKQIEKMNTHMTNGVHKKHKEYYEGRTESHEQQFFVVM